MTAREMLDKLLRAYEAYYNVETRHPAAPFAAEALFRSHETQYFLVRRARIAEAESNEFVYFALEETLTAPRLETLDAAAWDAGRARVTPHRDHRNSDITLLILASRADADALALVPKLKHYQSYCFGFQGWSHYRLAAIEAESGRMACNGQGKALRKFLKRNLGLR